MNHPLESVLKNDCEIDIENSLQENSIKNLKIVTCLQYLEKSNWFTGNQNNSHIIYAQSTQPSFIPDSTPLHIKQWKAEIKDQDNIIAQTRQNLLNPEQQNKILKVTTLTTNDIENILNLKKANETHWDTTLPSLDTMTAEITPGELCAQICQTFNLNKKTKKLFHNCIKCLVKTA